MVRITSALIVIVASSLSLVAAQSYQDFAVDATQPAQFADTVIGLIRVTGGVAVGEAACNDRTNCLGVICNSGSNFCVPIAYFEEGVTDTGTATGYDSIHYRYNTPQGPACRTALGDEFTSAEGQCDCGSDLTRQNTAFGCLLTVSPSQIVQRRRIANNRIMPGHAARSIFERRRTRASTGNAFV